MNTVGQTFKKYRSLKKLTIKKVSLELKITFDVLEKIENDEIDENIDIVFYLGHIRSYANFLDLNSQEIIAQFKLQHSYEKKVIIDQIPKPIIENPFLKFSKIFSFASIVIIFSTFYILFIDVEKETQDYFITPDIPENLEPIIEKELLLKKDNIANNNKEIDKILKNNFTESSAIASTETNENFLLDKNITLKFLNPTWIQLRDLNDKIILSQLMSKNDEFVYNIKNNYSLTAGNAGNILVTIDKEIRGKLGEFGQVVDSLIIDINFNN